MIYISPYQKLIQLKDYLDGIHQYVTVVGKWIFDSNFTFVIPLTKECLNYCCVHNNKTKSMSGYKEVLKEIRFFTEDNTKVTFRGENS